MTAVPVLLYHAIGEADELFTVTPKRFTEDALAVRDSGRTVLGVGDYVTRLRAGEPLDGLAVISFDDGHASTLDAARQLAELGLPCSVYVTSSYLGQPDMLDLGQLHELAQLPGVEIGSHSVRHVRLDELRLEALRVEVRDSRAALEDLLQRPVRGIAYPHGAHDRRVVREAVAAGFTSGAGVKNALSHERDDVMAVARMTVTATTNGEAVRRLLDGQGRLGERRPRLRTRGYRVVRRTRHVLRG